MLESRPLTVLQLLPALESGGVERGTLEVARALVERGHRALVMSAGGRQVAPLVDSGAAHFTWPVGKKSLTSLLLVRKLRQFLREQKVDIVHARSRVPAWIAWLAWRGMDPATRPRFVTTVHGPYSVSAYSAVMTRGERVIAISESIVDYIERNYPATPRDRIRLVYRGVDPVEFPTGYQASAAWLAQWHAAHPELRGKKILLLPARLTRWKGQTDFIEMLAHVASVRPDVHGLIVGETHPRKRAFYDELRALAQQHGVSANLSFIGHRHDLREIMATSTIVYSLSREPEAFGRVSLEALSLGKPVIAYDHGGVKEQLAAMLPAGAIPVGDIRRASTETLQWLDDSLPTPTQNPFTLDRMLSATLAVYAELGNAPHPGI